MAWVITRLCRDCVDQACVEVCPVDCIYGYDGSDAATFPNQLYIDPEECINCGVCEPECPWEAIFEDEQVPDVFQEDERGHCRIEREEVPPDLESQARLGEANCPEAAIRIEKS